MAFSRTDRSELDAFVARTRALPERFADEKEAGLTEMAHVAALRARTKAATERPVARTRRHRGDYHWSDVIATIGVAVEGGTPYLTYGSSSVPGWASWDKGSTNRPQFGPRRTGGKFFGPAIDEARDGADERGRLIAERALSDWGG